MGLKELFLISWKFWKLWQNMLVPLYRSRELTPLSVKSWIHRCVLQGWLSYVCRLKIGFLTQFMKISDFSGKDFSNNTGNENYIMK